MKTKHVVIGMMAAAAVGAVAGLLFAPASGKDTRKKIADGACDLADSVKNGAYDLVGKAKKSLRKNHLTDDMEVG
ncbi:MAG: YtxH domain-containing protein [Pseudobacter sp.]|uniref:YtxH domain-containing protein n=1 Tax=Pseudobacter sp. TaxID=2045420 RepID=UPI003F800AFF